MPLKTKRDKYDDTFSEFIRLRDGCCMKCGKPGTETKAGMIGGLECSHIFSRSHTATRYDPDNAKTMCFKDHRWWHENPPDAVEWLKSIIGQQAYDLLRYKANQVAKLKKWDKDHIRAELQEQIKLLKAGEIMPVFNPRFQQIRNQLNV